MHFAKKKQFWNKILQTDESALKYHLTRMTGRGEYRERKQGLMIQNIPHHLLNMIVLVCVCVCASGTESLVFNDYVTANKSTKMT